MNPVFWPMLAWYMFAAILTGRGREPKRERG